MNKRRFRHKKLLYTGPRAPFDSNKHPLAPNHHHDNEVFIFGRNILLKTEESNQFVYAVRGYESDNNLFGEEHRKILENYFQYQLIFSNLLIGSHGYFAVFLLICESRHIKVANTNKGLVVDVL